jgi:dTDP-4-dehydrorhamnose reductase
MKVLVIGSTGLLGQAVSNEVRSRGWSLVAVARSGGDHALDISDLSALDDCLDGVRPDLLFNCAALTDFIQCERDPGHAYRVNARPLVSMALWSRRTGRRLIHVSTDHYFITGGAAPHRENERVWLVNEYARSKYAGEAFALTAPRALVFRTSIVGIRGWDRPTLAEWAIRSVLDNAPVGLFTDAYTSSIDVGAFARAAIDVALGAATGLLNLASREVYSKAQFVQEIAAQMGRRLDNATLASLTAERPLRAGSLGLDVGKVQGLLEYPLPGLPEVVRAVLDEHGRRNGG